MSVDGQGNVGQHVYISHKRGKQIQRRGGNDTGGSKLRSTKWTHTAKQKLDHRDIELNGSGYGVNQVYWLEEGRNQARILEQ